MQHTELHNLDFEVGGSVSGFRDKNSNMEGLIYIFRIFTAQQRIHPRWIRT